MIYHYLAISGIISFLLFGTLALISLRSGSSRMQMISTAAMVASLITAVFSSTQVEAIAAAKKVDECRQEGGELIMLSQAPKERICVKGPLVKISAQPTPEGG